uniref:Uncharacterized protein n=1 Tax=Arcella intermedia TaxID=1963864 RepID=A0A6B2LKZ0_9EUKA
MQMGYGTGTGSGPDDTSGPPNIPRALLWYEKAVAQNQPDAMNALAEMYESGWGVDVDMQKAIELYQRAESFGEKDCLAALGRIFKEQKTEDGYTKALAYLLKAVEHNEEDTEAFFHIAELYENGWGVAADKNKAIEYYKKAAEFDDVEDATEALKRLGVSDE